MQKSWLSRHELRSIAPFQQIESCCQWSHCLWNCRQGKSTVSFPWHRFWNKCFRRCLGPNINGFLNSYGLGNVPNDFDIHWDGAITLVSLQEQSIVQINEDPQWKTTQDFRFDASKSNGTYSGNLVQPKALNALPCIRFWYTPNTEVQKVVACFQNTTN